MHAQYTFDCITLQTVRNTRITTCSGSIPNSCFSFLWAALLTPIASVSSNSASKLNGWLQQVFVKWSKKDSNTRLVCMKAKIWQPSQSYTWYCYDNNIYHCHNSFPSLTALHKEHARRPTVTIVCVQYACIICHLIPFLNQRKMIHTSLKWGTITTFSTEWLPLKAMCGNINVDNRSQHVA